MIRTVNNRSSGCKVGALKYSTKLIYTLHFFDIIINICKIGIFSLGLI